LGQPADIITVMSKHIPLTDQLRRAVQDCGKTQYRVAKETGIDKTALFRFLTGERGVSCKKMNILGEYLGLRIVADKPKSKTTKGR